MKTKTKTVKNNPKKPEDGDRCEECGNRTDCIFWSKKQGYVCECCLKEDEEPSTSYDEDSELNW